MSHARRWPTLLVWFAASACGAGQDMDGGVGDGGAAAQSMALGSQPPRATFVAAPLGASADLVHGPQGGYHVWLSVRATGVVLTAADDGVLVRYRVRSGADVVAEGRAYVPWEGVVGDVVSASGLRMYVVVPGAPPPLDGAEVTVEGTLEAEDGRRLARADSRWVLRCCTEE